MGFMVTAALRGEKIISLRESHISWLFSNLKCVSCVSSTILHYCDGALTTHCVKPNRAGMLSLAGIKWRGRCLPSQGDLDGRREAGGEEVGWEVRVHGQQFAGLAGGQLDAVLHGGRKRHLGQRGGWG